MGKNSKHSDHDNLEGISKPVQKNIMKEMNKQLTDDKIREQNNDRATSDTGNGKVR